MHSTPTFTGSGTDANGLTVTSWLSRVLNLASANQLTFDATIGLLIQGSGGGAAEYLEQMRDEGKTLHQVVQQLEMRYGDLSTPEEAVVKCNSLLRKDKEPLPDFLVRLRTMARMATRMNNDNLARIAAIELLVEANIRRVLPTSVRNALEERVINRSRMGLPAFTAREIEKECHDLEKRRDERKQVLVVPGPVKQHHHIRQMQFDEPDNFGSDDDDSSTEEEAAPEDVQMDLLVNEIRQQEKRYAAKGREVHPQKVYRKAFQRYDEKRQKLDPNARKFPGRYGAKQAQNLPRPAGPPNRLDGPRRTIDELLNLANCTKGQCIQCGMDGHIMKQPMCALKDKCLVDRACFKCGKGLHSADDCLMAFQRYAAQQPVQPANPLNQNQAAQSEPLNEQ
jgi:hypothetical protein